MKLVGKVSTTGWGRRLLGQMSEGAEGFYVRFKWDGEHTKMENGLYHVIVLLVCW